MSDRFTPSKEPPVPVGQEGGWPPDPASAQDHLKFSFQISVLMDLMFNTHTDQLIPIQFT
jgi:hypothetical protein